jgi:hypothetical protein
MHTPLSIFGYLALGLGAYFLFIGLLCRFLAFSERSDEIRSQLRAGLDPFKEERSGNESRLSSRSLAYFRASPGLPVVVPGEHASKDGNIWPQKEKGKRKWQEYVTDDGL